MCAIKTRPFNNAILFSLKLRWNYNWQLSASAINALSNYVFAVRHIFDFLFLVRHIFLFLSSMTYGAMMSPQPTIWSKPGYQGEKTIGNHCNSIRGYQGIRGTRVSGISGMGMRKPLNTIAISGVPGYQWYQMYRGCYIVFLLHCVWSWHIYKLSPSMQDLRCTM